MVVILIIVALIYCSLPWYVEFAAWLINLFIPDTLPFIDELLMFVPIVSKIKKTIFLADILERYWPVFILALIALIVIIVVILV